MSAELVSVIKTPRYGREEAVAAVRRHFAALGVKEQVGPATRALIKPNLLMKRAPEGATTTHPNLVYAAVVCLQELGVREIVIADSPGGPYTESALRGIYRACGMEEVARDTGARLNFDLGEGERENPAGVKAKKFAVIAPICRADFIVDVAKCKTHCMTTLSGGVKNLFGSIPGLQKPRMHYRFPETEDFSQMLLDLCGAVRPDLVLVDAVECMEGDGPSSGVKKQVGLTLCGRSPYAVDECLCRLMGFSPEQVATVRLARARGLFGGEVALTGDEDALQNRHFQRPRSSTVDFMAGVPAPLRRPARWVMRTLFTPRPLIDTAACVGCGKCAESCPPQTIVLEGGKARIRRERCIRCYCCHEMCPVGAIRVSKNILTKH